MQGPSLQGYGLSEDDLVTIIRWRRHLSSSWFLMACVGVCAMAGFFGFGLLSGNSNIAALGASLGVFCGIRASDLAWPLAIRFNSRVQRYEQFRATKDAFESAKKEREEQALRARAEFWKSLSGHRFEHELATLFERAGYSVQRTPGSGDAGIDIVLRHHGRTTIVQCKQTKHPVGPAVARELFGALKHSNADDAILAVTGGVTSGVHQFFVSKPLRVMELLEILSLHMATSGSN